MHKQIYLGDRSSRQGYWTSFESDPHLTLTRNSIYGRCVPCIESLMNQLVEGKDAIKLNQAFDCWKVVVVLDDETECLQLLAVLEQRASPVHRLRGRFGSKEKEGGKAVIFNADNCEERDLILSYLEQSVKQVKPDARVFYSRACNYLHGQVLGDGSDWATVTPLKNPENIAEVIRRCRKALYDW